MTVKIKNNFCFNKMKAKIHKKLNKTNKKNHNEEL